MNDYKEEIRILRRAMANKKLVVFVGSGVSINSGMPTWKSAVGEIADKLGIERPQNTEEYLKLPQYYFNSRGKKEYVELIRDIFLADQELPIHDCHRRIISLNTQTIITTNYDHLLENAAKELQEMIQIVAHNRDLPYKTAEREIIKIHGDFEHDNIVLKEDDYLHYSNEFAMIEAYVKSLIATNVVLFVGYSFSDPDVKQIFSWVKSVLKDDFQRAYLFEVCDKYDSLKCEYYRNLGVNVLYASEMRHYRSSSKAEKLCRFLDELSSTTIEGKLLEEIELNCKSINELNYINRDSLERIFSTIPSYCEGEEMNVYTKESLKLIKDKIANSKIINECLEKSPVRRIAIRNHNSLKSEKLSVSDKMLNLQVNSDLFESIRTFNYSKLISIREINDCYLAKDTPLLYLQQAYISYWLQDYLLAYQYLKNSSQLFYEAKLYAWFFISEYNRLQIGKLLCRNCSLSQEITTKISDEIVLINLDLVLERMPNSPGMPKDFLRDIYTGRMHLDELRYVINAGEEVKEETEKTYLVHSNHSYKKLRDEVKDYLYFELFNFLLVERNREIYKHFAKTIIESASCRDITLKNSFNDNMVSQNVHAKNLEAFDILIILQYLSAKEISSCIGRIRNNHIALSDDAKQFILVCISNLIDHVQLAKRYIGRILSLFGVVEVDNEIARALLTMLERIITSDYVLLEGYNNTNRLLISFKEQGIFSDESCRILLLKAINQLLERKKEKDNSLTQKINALLINMLFILSKTGDSCFSTGLMEYVRTPDYLFLAKIYESVDRRIKGQISRTLKKWQWNKTVYDADVYTTMVVNDIKNANSDCELEMIDLLNANNKIKGVKKNPDSEYLLLDRLLTLYLNDKIINREKVLEVLVHAGKGSIPWLVQMDSFDYNKFEFDWLLECSSALLESISKNDIARKEILQRVRQLYSSKQTLSDDLVGIIVRYFI